MNDQGVLQPQISASLTTRTNFWTETRATCLLALPIIFGQLLQNGLSVIDTVMVGRVSVEAVAAASLATALFVVPLVFGFGVMGPFSVFVARANARGETSEIVHHLRRGLVMSVSIGVALAILITALSGHLNLLHQPSTVLVQARSFLLLLTWSIVPMYLFQILKQYCEALHTAWPPMLILTAGALINIALNWVFIFGHLGAPALGLIGAGWATLITRTVMLAALVLVVRQIHFQSAALRNAFFRGAFQWQGYRDLLGLGLPAGFQVILEVGAFTFAAIMMGWVSEAALAAHQVAISVASTVFMVPLGLSMAVAIRVSHAIGSDDPRRARACVRGSLLLTLGFMCLTAITICTFAHGLAALFIRDPEVIILAAQVLLIAGFFQIFDGTQAICIGALRGLHDVKLPTFLSFCAYWLIGLPVSYLLAFHFQLGAVGIWLGLLVGLALISGLLLARLKVILRRAGSGR